MLLLSLLACADAPAPPEPAPSDEERLAALVKPEAPTESQLAHDRELVAKYTPRLGVPAGTRVVIEATAFEGFFKGYEHGPNLLVTRIDGRPTQDYRAMPVRLEGSDDIPYRAFPKGTTWRMEGYERVVAEGDYPPPPGVHRQGTGGRYATSRFVASAYTEQPLTPFDPAEFVGREALVSGRAKPGWIDGGTWRIARHAPWPAGFVGKEVEVRGAVRATSQPATFEVEGEPRLVRLEDQVGKRVELRGTLWSDVNFHWLDYRGEKVALESSEEPNGHGDPFVLRGVLARESRADVGSLMKQSTYYVVKQATCEETTPLLVPELGPL